MRRNEAFRFVEELVGDIAHVQQLSGNPRLMYVESAVKTIHMAASLFDVFEEHINTERKRVTEQTIRRKYEELLDTTAKNYQEEVLKKIDIDFETVRLKVRDGQFRDKAVRSFITSLTAELKKVLDIFESARSDQDLFEQSRVDELLRRVLRDYNALLQLNAGTEG